jgi:DNA-directed RNA polymerase specialized sigma54-like protein
VRRDYSGWPVVKRQALALNASTLSWMEYGVHNVHVVDSKSPLRSVVNQIRATGTVPNSFNILVTINCVQSATGSVLTRMHSYCQPNIQFNKRFKPLLMDEGDHVVLRSVEESHELMDDLSLLSVRRPTLKQVAMYIIADNKAQAQKEKARARKVSMRSAANTIIG